MLCNPLIPNKCDTPLRNADDADNAAAEQARRRDQVGISDDKIPDRQPQDFLLRIAAACAKFICEADFSYVRNCEGPTCTLYFHDVSKNRAKAAAHRKAAAAASEV